MLHTSMELRVLPVQLAMLEVAGTISAIKVGVAGFFVIPHIIAIIVISSTEEKCSHHHIMVVFSLACHERTIAIVLFSAALHSVSFLFFPLWNTIMESNSERLMLVFGELLTYS